MSSASTLPVVEVKSETLVPENKCAKKVHDPSELTDPKEPLIKKTFSGTKRKPVYNLDDNIIKVVRADNDVHFKLLSNNKGVFIDIRRYNRGFPTQKGVRVYASVFKKVSELLRDDIDVMVPKDDLELSKSDKIISI
jgi:hypothetical protein